MARIKAGGRPIRVTSRKVRAFSDAYSDLAACADFDERVPEEIREAFASAAEAAEAWLEETADAQR